MFCMHHGYVTGIHQPDLVCMECKNDFSTRAIARIAHRRNNALRTAEVHPEPAVRARSRTLAKAYEVALDDLQQLLSESRTA